MRLILFFIVVLFGVKSLSQERDLHYYIEKAARNSPLLTDYNNQIKAASIDSLLNRAAYKPQLSGNVNASYAPVINGYGYDTALSNGQVVSAVAGVNQKILGKGQTTSQAESFRLIKSSLALNKKIAEKDLAKAVTAQYITAWGTAEQLRYNEKNAALLTEEDNILKKLTRSSVYKQTDYLIFNATVKQQQLVTLQLQQQYRNDLAMLNYLTGEADNGQVTLKQPDVAIRAIADSRPLFLQQFETDSLSIRNANRLIANTYKPSLLLLADAGYNSSLVYDAYKNFGFSVGLGLSIPISDGGQKKLRYQKNSVALETIGAYKSNFQRQHAQQLYMLNLKLSQAEETAAALQAQLSVSEGLIAANRKLLLSGDAQITEYILALSNLVSIQSGISQSNVSRLQTINELNYWKTNE